MTDEQLYEAVGEELASGELRRGLWLKALHETGGDEGRARLRYVGLRVQAMRGERRAESRRQMGRKLARGGGTSVQVLSAAFHGAGIILCLGLAIVLVSIGAWIIADGTSSIAEGVAVIIVGLATAAVGIAWVVAVHRRSEGTPPPDRSSLPNEHTKPAR
jgi:hypothetical protein